MRSATDFLSLFRLKLDASLNRVRRRDSLHIMVAKAGQMDFRAHRPVAASACAGGCRLPVRKSAAKLLPLTTPPQSG
jgi:hypothetical protein